MRLLDRYLLDSFLKALLFSLSVAVGLTPEMLPMIVTVNLAKGALTMSRKKVIVKKLPSIQNFGAIDILCTDKTGTLTEDRIVLERHLDVRDPVASTLGLPGVVRQEEDVSWTVEDLIELMNLGAFRDKFIDTADHAILRALRGAS